MNINTIRFWIKKTPGAVRIILCFLQTSFVTNHRTNSTLESYFTPNLEISFEIIFV